MEGKPVYAWSFHRMELNRGNNYREPKEIPNASASLGR